MISLDEDSLTDISSQSDSTDITEDVAVGATHHEVILFNDDPLTPVYKCSKVPVPTKEAVASIVFARDERKVASAGPTFVSKNVSFLISLNKIGHWKDVLADMMGKWKNTRVKHQYYFCENDDGILEDLDMAEFGQRSTYHATRFIYHHVEAPDFHRVLVKVDNKDNKCMPYVYLQYYFDQEEHHVTPTLPHGNSKKKVPFQRTKESVKEKRKTACVVEKPKNLVQMSFEGAGGLANVRSAGDMARDRKQVSNFKYFATKQGSHDELITVTDMCKAQQRDPATAFVRSVSCAPEQHVYVGNDRQHNDLARFCTNVENTSIVGIDPTYNMGKFYVTVTTYRHLMLHIREFKHAQPKR
eukprot:gene20731-biopygen17115